MVHTRSQMNAGIQREPKRPRVTAAVRSSQRLQQTGISSGSKRRCNDSETTRSRESLRQDSGSCQFFEAHMTTEHSLESLPEEILCQIFGHYFSLKERITILELVSKTFGRICQLTYRLQKTLRFDSFSHLLTLAPKVGPYVETLEFDFVKKRMGDHLEMIPQAFPKVKVIFWGHLDFCLEDDPSYMQNMLDVGYWLFKFTALETVHFDNDISLNYFFTLDEIFVFHDNDIKLVFNVVAIYASISLYFRKAEELEKLRNAADFVTQISLRVNHANLGDAADVNDVDDLPQLHKLTRLGIHSWSEESSSLEFFREKVPNLTRLELRECSLDFGNISFLRKLEHLEISGTSESWSHGRPRLLRGSDLARIGQNCTSMRVLDLRLDYLEREHMDAISANFPSSIDLRVTNPPVPGELFFGD